MKIQPANGLLLLKREDPKTETASGIALPDSAIKVNHNARVVTLPLRSDKMKEQHPDLVVGSLVRLHPHKSGIPIELGGVDYLLYPEEDILGYYNEEE